MQPISDDFLISSDVYSLVEVKERLKDSILDPTLNWQERMSLYQKIHEINDRIHQLSTQ